MESNKHFGHLNESDCQCDAPSPRRWVFTQIADQTAKGMILALVASWIDSDRLTLLVIPWLAFGMAVASTLVGDRKSASIFDP